uniref:Piwi domain-containing protein n=1 Tax=Ditylenchus dipsaci TaxID=166011 RepID=A0A915DEB1_9BILA
MDMDQLKQILEAQTNQHALALQQQQQQHQESLAQLVRTANTPRFTVLYNEMAKMLMDDLQRIRCQLCNGHQIVSLPTLLPTLAYIADCYALRGRNIFDE